MNNIMHTIIIIMVTIALAIMTEPMVGFIFIICVGFYAVLTLFTNMYLDRKAAQDRMEQVMFTQYLNERIVEQRTALPLSDWLDVKR